MRRLLTISLAASLVAPSTVRARVEMTSRLTGSAEEESMRVARKRRARAVKVEPVRIRSSGTQALSLRQKGRRTTPVYTVTPDDKLTFEVTGPGKLALVLHQLLPPSVKSKRHVFLVSVDGKRAARVKVTNRPYRRGSATGVVARVSNGKKRFERIRGGKHTVEITAPAASAGAVVRVEMYVNGASAAAPVVIEPAAEPGRVVRAPPPAPEPPPPTVAPAPPPEPVAAPAPAIAEPVAPGAALAARMRNAEVRDGLVGTYSSGTIVNAETGERTAFSRIAAEQSYTFMVQGPGEVTVHIHRLVAPEAAAASSGYKVVILENDVLLQQLDGDTAVDPRLTLEPASPLALSPPAVADGKEYRLKVGPKQSRFAFQIAQAPEGMLVRYEFAPEEMSLAAMALDFDDEDGEEGIGLSMGGNSMPTVVTEIDVTERTIVVEKPTGFLGLGGFAGTMVPVAGGGMGLVAGGEITFELPWFDRALALSARAAFIRHEMAASIADPMGTAIAATSTVYAIPVVGKVIGRWRLAEVFALMVYGGAGVSFVSVERAALDATSNASQWLWTARGGLGCEVELGPGAVVVDAGYLYAPTADFGTSLLGYSPAGPVFTVGYLMGL